MLTRPHTSRRAFFFNDTATTEIYTLSLHDALPIAQARWRDLSTVPLANGEPIPTLAQALEVLDTLRVFVEVKVLDPRWDDRLLATLDRGPNPGGYAVHSFAFQVIRRLGAKRPALPRGVLSEVATKDPRGTLADASAQTLWQERSK